MLLLVSVGVTFLPSVEIISLVASAVGEARVYRG